MAIGGIGNVLRQIQVAFKVGTVTGLTDRQLVERFAVRRDPGAEVAFAALVQRHGPMVMRVCRSILRIKMMLLYKLKVAAASLAIGCSLFSISVLCFGRGSESNGPGAAQGGTEANRQEPAPNSTSRLRSTSPPDEPGALPQQPKPWETAVRMRIRRKESVSMGSGTIIESAPEKSIILTAGHYFKVDGFEQFVPSKFPHKIEIDLFDGKLTGSDPAQVHFLETVAGELMDYDFDRDVALIQIRPGRRLAASRIVPSSWEPRIGMQVLTVGCSDGNDATAWHTTITNPSAHGLAERPNYQAIECMTAPKQGRSGGGLFTGDGFLAGVCNYAEPRADRGLYAPPSSFYDLLGRNGLAVVDHRLDDQIRALEEMINRETLKLRLWKEQRKITAAARRSHGPDPSPPPAVGPDMQAVIPHSEPTRQPSAPPDYEGRLRDVEQKLDRIIKLLEGAERKPAPRGFFPNSPNGAVSNSSGRQPRVCVAPPKPSPVFVDGNSGVLSLPSGATS